MRLFPILLTSQETILLLLYKGALVFSFPSEVHFPLLLLQWVTVLKKRKTKKENETPLTELMFHPSRIFWW